jgi:hypothetical protein
MQSAVLGFTPRQGPQDLSDQFHGCVMGGSTPKIGKSRATQPIGGKLARKLETWPHGANRPQPNYQTAAFALRSPRIAIVFIQQFAYATRGLLPILLPFLGF